MWIRIDQTYLLFLHSEGNNCFPSFSGSSDGTEHVLEFKAVATSHTLSIFNPCTFSTTVRLSIGCSSCPAVPGNRNLMGISADENYTPEELIRDVFIGGDCFDVSEQSINFQGDELARGVFTNGTSSINMEEG